MRILIIEDEKKTSAFLQKGLSERGFFVEAAENGEDGLLSARAGNHDLIVLDVMLPGRDGWSIITELRHANLHTPVLFLTARDLVRDRVKGLELGADDYLIKPFAFSELFARIRSILKRGPVRQESTVRIGDLEIDPRLHKALRAGRGLQLTTKEFTLLVYLAQFSPDVVSRTSIAEHVWDINFDTGTNMVEAAIRRLRAKVDDSFEKKLIHTVRGIGYVLEAR
ncbi:MAG TPA: heavy metal response regulator transcription factor [Terrimicrobiaceae bacterium]|nr:heavy metal response regulator transcription factor [Terrimicrobiaceae bacterium]